jgi:hypothetical protein
MDYMELVQHKVVELEQRKVVGLGLELHMVVGLELHILQVLDMDMGQVLVRKFFFQRLLVVVQGRVLVHNMVLDMEL